MEHANKSQSDSVRLNNSNNKYNPHIRGSAGVINTLIVKPEGYYENWTTIWKVLNNIPDSTELSLQQKDEIIQGVDLCDIEEKQIAKFEIENFPTELSETLLVIRNLRNKQILSVKEIIKTLVAKNRLRYTRNPFN